MSDSENIFQMLRQREGGQRRQVAGPSLVHQGAVHEAFIRRLKLFRELEGHDGCVNTVSYNLSGSLCVSGSDDRNLIVRNTSSGEIQCSWATNHRGNIFCALFVPENSDRRIASCAFGGRIIISDLAAPNVAKEYQVLNCHVPNRAMKMCIQPGNPNVLFSVGEDCTVRRHDLRVPHACHDMQCDDIILKMTNRAQSSASPPGRYTTSGVGMNSISLNPTNHHQFVTGGNDQYVRLYDLRFLSSSAHGNVQRVLEKYSPSHIRRRQGYYVTSVVYGECGRVLSSYSEDQIYLFDVRHPADSQQVPHEVLFACTTHTPLPLQDASVGDEMVGARSTKRARSAIQPCGPVASATDSSVPPVQDTRILQLPSGFDHICGHCEKTAQEMGHPMIRCSCRKVFYCSTRCQSEAWDVHKPHCKGNIEDSAPITGYSFFDDFDTSLLPSAPPEGTPAGESSNGGPCSQRKPVETAEPMTTGSPGHQSSGEDDKDNSDDSDDDNDADPRRRAGGGPRNRAIRRLVTQLSHAQQRATGESQADSHASPDQLDSIAVMASPGTEPEAVLGTSLGRHSNPTEQEPKPRRRVGEDQDDGEESADDDDEPQDIVLDGHVSARHDYVQKFTGHCNRMTIKEVNFFGPSHVVSGSDCGHIFIWRADTAGVCPLEFLRDIVVAPGDCSTSGVLELVQLLKGDADVVNVVQPHPNRCQLITSGIENTIKLWEPLADSPSTLEGAEELIEKNTADMDAPRPVGIPINMLVQLLALQSQRENDGNADDEDGGGDGEPECRVV